MCELLNMKRSLFMCMHECEYLRFLVCIDENARIRRHYITELLRPILQFKHRLTLIHYTRGFHTAIQYIDNALCCVLFHMFFHLSFSFLLLSA